MCGKRVVRPADMTPYFHESLSLVQSSSLSAFLSDLKLTRWGPLLLRGVAKIRETGGQDLAGERGGALNGVRFLWLNGVSGRNTGVGRGVGIVPDISQASTRPQRSTQLNASRKVRVHLEAVFM